ncbi:CRISPR-associated protein Csx19 [Frankia sp. Ag45/Mut15]|uniref:CRISPR-associated protein Csx19 n=1 Tax=Frankia umida TaxID=573489 RepID=A0ABT0K4I2_9ACTN|nr:CRISPR-associated protein Csx19 [Frankia umida]MCK9878665.1 CRISPR-associated protein Csx19 [Frankia umida]
MSATTTAVSTAATSAAAGGATAGDLRLGWRRVDGPLADVLRVVLAERPSFAGATALLSTPSAFRLARLAADGTCVTADGTPVHPDDVFEGRLFTADVELRWVRRLATGDGVLLGEDVTGGAEATGLAAHDGHYLLWGEHTPAADQPGWRGLSSQRIGLLLVPVDDDVAATTTNRLRLVVREYLAYDLPTAEPDPSTDALDAHGHGNAYVLDERLVRVEAYEFARHASGQGTNPGERHG